jgi:hypothetical protein
LHKVIYDNHIPRDIKNIPIYLQICWDGAQISNTVQRDSMWPIIYSILNFPPSMRNQLHLGLHVASFDTGTRLPLTLLALELKSLFENPIEFKGYKYYVVVSQILMDGPGRNSFCKLIGPKAFSGGCNVCDFKGVVF